LGLSVRETVLALYLVAVGGGAVGFWMFNAEHVYASGLFAAWCTGLLACAYALRRDEVRRRTPAPDGVRSAPGRLGVLATPSSG
jgi:hypothetical protein